MEYTDCRIAIMSDGAILRNLGAGWKTSKRVKAGVYPVACATTALAQYQARPAEFHGYIRTLTPACDVEHRAQIHALVDQMPEHPDAVWSLFDQTSYELRIEEVVRCCRSRLALDAPSRKLAA
jgi:hypothetical protein